MSKTKPMVLNEVKILVALEEDEEYLTEELAELLEVPDTQVRKYMLAFIKDGLCKISRIVHRPGPGRGMNAYIITPRGRKALDKNIERWKDAFE